MDITERTLFSATAITLDANGELPTRIPLFVTGDWPDSVKGNFSVSVDDLKEMKAHFDAGVGFPTEDGTTGLAIDFEHKWLEKAAAWIKGLELQIDPSDPSRAILYAVPVEWTAAGAQAIKDGLYKCISPMGSFGRKNGKLSLWSNVNNLKEKTSNVLEGAGLTNAPFLRGMAPIKADKTEDLHNANGNVIYVYDVRQKEQNSMNLDALRVKEREALSVPELDFLAEKREQLSAEEVTKFKLSAPAVAPTLSDEDKQTLDAIKSGSKKVVDTGSAVVEKEQLDRLENTAKQYREEKVQTILDKHVKRGAIKQDNTEFWGKQLLAADDATRANLESALDALPDNDLLAKEIGSAEDVAAGSTAREQLSVLAQKAVTDAAKDGKELLYADALKQVARQNPDLQKQDLKEQGIK